LVPYASEEALTLSIKVQVTESQHTKIQSQEKMKNCTIYPSYYEIKVAKEECNSYEGKILVYKSLVEVKMHSSWIQQLQKLSWLKKLPYILFWTKFRKNSLSFQNGVAM
jgi:hypothetical protein